MESVRLEPLNETHLAAVAAMLSDPDVLRFTRVPDPTPAALPYEWLALYEAGRRDGTRKARGRGAGTAILRAATDWAFADLGLLRIRLIIDTLNGVSLRVAERSGYVREGVLRSLHFKAGRRIDAVLLSRQPSDPPPP